MSEQPTIFQYKTQGTCSQLIQLAIQDNKIADVQFHGGCNGNLKGIRSLVTGMDIDEVIEKLQGITCGPRPTSCPDQLAKSLIEYKQQSAAIK